ncbi:MAG: DUF2971 domain-containing protein [Verrucomicrobiales bacterium]
MSLASDTQGLKNKLLGIFMRLYYLTGAQYALENVRRRRVKISRIEDLNDPFELLGVDLRHKELREPFREAKSRIDSNTGIVCLSETWQSPVMWAHYGAKHTGICLGFDVFDDLASPVIYEGSPLKVEGYKAKSKSQLVKEFRNRLLLLKFDEWAYERERRMILSLTKGMNDGSLYFVGFSPKFELKEIILGARCAEPISVVRAIAKTFSHKVHVKKARVAFTKFAVVEDRRHREKNA